MNKNSNSNKKLSKLSKIIKENLGSSFDLAGKILVVEQVWEKKSGKTIVVLWFIFLVVLVVIKIIEEESIENFLSRIQEFVTYNQYLLNQLINEAVKRISAENCVIEVKREAEEKSQTLENKNRQLEKERDEWKDKYQQEQNNNSFQKWRSGINEFYELGNIDRQLEKINISTMSIFNDSSWLNDIGKVTCFGCNKKEYHWLLHTTFTTLSKSSLVYICTGCKIKGLSLNFNSPLRIIY